MRAPKTTQILLAGLLAVAPFAVSCNRDRAEAPEQASTQTTTQLPQTAEPQTQATYDAPTAPVAPAPPAAPAPDNELRQDRTVVLDHGEDRADRDDLTAREHDLARREAAVEAREQRLHQRRPVAPAPSAHRTPQPAAAPDRPDRIAESPEPERSEPAAPAPEPRPEPRPDRIATVPAGTPISVELLDGLSSNRNHEGDTFRARISSSVTSDGEVVIPANSEVTGVVTQAVPLGRVGGQAKLAIRLTDLVLPSGRTVPIAATYAKVGRNETRKDAATIGGAAAGGAILGRVIDKHHRSKGTVLGAIIGAAAGTAVASKTPGEEVVLADGSVLELQLADSVEVHLRR